MKIAYIATWPPRPCGIATFAFDLASAIEGVEPSITWSVVCINEPGAKRDYDEKVGFIIEQEDIETYKKAAEYINNNNFDLVGLQHEFNIYGGKQGEWIVKTLSLIKKSIVTTLHTIPFPEIWSGNNPEKKIEVLKQVASLSKRVITMSKTGFDKLSQSYGIPSEKISIIPHGGPQIEQIPIEKAKEKLGIDPKTFVLSSYGLVRKDKNFEMVIKALPQILKVQPNTKFLICGEEHPILSKGYYEELQQLIDDLKLNDSVKFVNRYLSLEEIIQYLQATDVFLHTPSILSLSSSGTLTYAIIAGRTIVATPFVYAKEVLKERGIFVPLNDIDKLAKEIVKIIQNPQIKKEKENEMYRFGQNFLWPKAAKKYIDVFSQVAKGKNE